MIQPGGVQFLPGQQATPFVPTFAVGNVGSIGGSYAPDGIATFLLTDVSGSPAPAEIVLAAVENDRIEVRTMVRLLISGNTFMSLQMVASDDNFATSDVIPWTLLDYTSVPSDERVEPTMFGVLTAPRAGTWKIRILIRCLADPTGLGASWVDEPLWMVGNNWGQAA